MVNTSPSNLNIKYKKILSQEQSWAISVARSVIKQRPISVWEVMIPVLLIFLYAKSKTDRETFIQNLLFTKKLALEAAFDMIEKGQGKEKVMARIKDKTGDILASDTKGIYSQKIRLKQMKEIELLLDHYRRLLEAEGKDYDTMTKNAYQTLEKYMAFLDQLEQAEKEVYNAAQKTVKAATAFDLVSKMERATEMVRRARAEKIFEINN